MRQDDAIPVVVLDFGKYLSAVGRCEIFLARVQDFCVRVCLAERVGNFVYIRFQADNQRLLYQSQTLHFIGRDAHNHGLACAYFVPADTTTVLLNHPDCVFLRRVEFVVRELLKGKLRKGLCRAVIGRTDIAVETLVVCAYQFIPDFQRTGIEPLVEIAADFLYLGGRFLNGFLVGHTYLVAVAIHFFGYLRHCVMQGMDKQVFTVEIAHGIGVVCCRGVTFQTHYIGIIDIKVHHFGFHPEKFCRKVGVKLRVNPTLAHVYIQLFIGNCFGRCVLQCPCGDFRPIPFPAGQVIKAG